MSLVDQAATSTLPKLLQRNAEQDPKGPGIREKSRGVWQTLTWTGYRDQMRDFALGLAAIGFKRGDKLSVVGDNRPQLYIAQLSAQVLGGISVPVYQDSIASELVFQRRESLYRRIRNIGKRRANRQNLVLRQDLHVRSATGASSIRRWNHANAAVRASLYGHRNPSGGEIGVGHFYVCTW